MAQQPYDPFRGRNNRPIGPKPPRRGLPLPALVMLAVTPALIVSAFVFWQMRGGEGPGPSVASAGTEFPVESTAEALVSSLASASPAANPPDAATPANAAPPTALGLPVPDLSASAAVVVDDASMEVLYDLDAYSPRAPASVTKMATAVVAMEHGRLDDIVTSTVHYWDLAYEGDSTTMGLVPGDKLTLRELLYGLMLVSGNDAAKVIAEHVAGSEPAFVEKMNDLAERLGIDRKSVV